MPFLSVKIDSVAAVRNVRKLKEPAPSQAAVLAELAGADGITCHLREDRLYIRDRDFYILKEVAGSRLTLQIAPDDELHERALEVKPWMVTLMPFAGNEPVFNRGINFEKDRDRYADAASSLHEAGIIVTYFVDPESEAIKEAARVKADAVELNLYDYAGAVTDEDIDAELNRLEQMAQLAAKLGMKVFAGNGLNYRNIGPVAALSVFDRFTVGYAIISRALMTGMDRAVRDMLELISRTGEN